MGAVPGSELRAHFLALTNALLTDHMNDAARWTTISSDAKRNCGHVDVIQWSLEGDFNSNLAPISPDVAITWFAENTTKMGYGENGSIV